MERLSGLAGVIKSQGEKSLAAISLEKEGFQGISNLVLKTVFESASGGARKERFQRPLADFIPSHDREGVDFKLSAATRHRKSNRTPPIGAGSIRP